MAASSSVVAQLGHWIIVQPIVYHSPMLRSRRLWFVLLAGLVLAGGAWLWTTSLGMLPSTKDADRVMDGMTKADVIAILGTPREPFTVINIPQGDRPAMWHREFWDARDGVIFIAFDKDGLVFDREVARVGVFRWQWRRIKYQLGL